MSATNRSNVRRTNDHYVTPNWCVKRFLEAYVLPANTTVLDPCAANGELLLVVKTARPDVKVMGIELRLDCLPDLLKVTGGEAVAGDFLPAARNMADKVADVILTNPPYSLAEEFIRASLPIADVVVMLLRINFIRGDGRHRLMRETNPGIFVLPDRPSFTGRGMDATEYAWFVWGDPKVAGRWFMLNETPLEQRTEWNQQARILHPVENNEGVTI